MPVNLRYLRRILLMAAVAPLATAPVLAQGQQPAAPAAPPAAAAAAPALPPPSPLKAALEKAAGDVLQNAPVPIGTRAELLIDPLIDGNTGAQSRATRSIEAQVRQIISAKFASKYDVKPFTSENVAKQPLVFIGTFTPIHATAQIAGPRDAYRVCFAIIDTRTRQIVSKGFARATTEGVNAVPTPAFADAPIWMKDPAVDGYVRTCQGTKAGDPINAAYSDKVGVASLIAEAVRSYDAGRYAAALDLYTKARALPGGDQLRVHNGLYLTNLKLGRQADAQKALQDLVDYGLKSEKIGMMLLFVKNSTSFAPSSISSAYPAWLKTVAETSAARKSCLEVVGHASRTGTEAYNDRLSAQRAAAIEARLARISPALAKSLKSTGQGWRENIVGTGKDDASDALDRRVEFKVAKCA